MGLFKKKNEEKELEGKERIDSYECFEDVLNLGWYWSENREELQLAKIAEKDRASHFYIIGATGTGKTKFIEYLIQQDIGEGNGFGVIDPHGDLVEDVKGFLAINYSPQDEEISERIILIDPTDPDYTVTFNPLEELAGISTPSQVNELVYAFKKIWQDAWGVRMEDLMRNSLLALSETGFSLTELSPFLTKRSFREAVLSRVSQPIVLDYFQRFDSLTDRAQVTWVEPVTNKINAFFADERIRQMFSSPRSSFNLREIMDERKILLLKLDKGKLKESADLLGSLFMAKIQMAAFSRSDFSPERRVPFYLYIDEFQNFASESFSVILSEARKYGLSLIMAHQTLAQIPEELRSLILGNTGIQVYFRLNRHDANVLAKEAFDYSGYEVKAVSDFRPIFWSLSEEWEHYVSELQNLPPRTCYVKHKIEGGIIPIWTEEIVSPKELLGMEEDEYREFLKNYPFGKRYLVAREELSSQEEERRKKIESEFRARLIPEVVQIKESKKEISPQKVAAEPSEKVVTGLASGPSEDEFSFLEYIAHHPGRFVTQLYKDLGLSGYKGDRLKESLIEKGLIVQEETRQGSKGRLAKILVLTEKGASTLRKQSAEGKGGDLHKQLQIMIKDQAEVFGWKAVIEERIPRSLESVDVGLRKEDVRVAIEISATSRPEQEIQNIRKCLEAGYDYVIVVCHDEKGLQAIKKEVKKTFSAREKERIRVCGPDEVKKLLSSLAPGPIVSEKAIVSGQISKEKQLLNTKEAAEFLGISKNTLYEWIIQKKIPHIKVGRLVKFKREDMEAWLKRRIQEEKKDFV